MQLKHVQKITVVFSLFSAFSSSVQFDHRVIQDLIENVYHNQKRVPLISFSTLRQLLYTMWLKWKYVPHKRISILGIVNTGDLNIVDNHNVTQEWKQVHYFHTLIKSGWIIIWTLIRIACTPVELLMDG